MWRRIPFRTQQNTIRDSVNPTLQPSPLTPVSYVPSLHFSVLLPSVLFTRTRTTTLQQSRLDPPPPPHHLTTSKGLPTSPTKATITTENYNGSVATQTWTNFPRNANLVSITNWHLPTWWTLGVESMITKFLSVSVGINIKRDISYSYF